MTSLVIPTGYQSSFNSQNPIINSSLNPSPSIDVTIPPIQQGMEEMANERVFQNVFKCADSNEIKAKHKNGTMEYEENEGQKCMEISLENESKIVADENDDRQSSCSSKKSSPISSSSNSRPEKRKWEKPELCLICGQSAQCFNFGAHCCHACRMFFRRSVLNFKKLSCKYNGNCDITKGKNCRSCRFDACVLNQLDISLIQFPPKFNVSALKQYLDERRQELLMKRNKNNQNVGKIDGNQISLFSIIYLMESNRLFNNLMMTEKQAKTLRNSPNNLLLEYFCGKSLADLLNCQINVLNFVEFFTENGSPLKNDKIRMMEANGFPFIANYLNLDIFLNIELMRNLSIFNQSIISLEDKLLIFQQNIHRLATLSSAFYSLEFNSDSIIYPNGIRPFNLCRITLENKLTDEKLKSYLNLRRRSFCNVIDEFRAMKMSTEEFVLLRAIIFCNNVPEKCSENVKILLKNEAEKYSQIMLRNLQTKLGEFIGAQKFAEYLCFAVKMFDYNRCQAKFYQIINQMAFGIQNGPNPLHPPFIFECLQQNWNDEKIFFKFSKKNI